MLPWVISLYLFYFVKYFCHVPFICLYFLYFDHLTTISYTPFLNYGNQVKQVKPDVLLGLSAVGGLFSKEVRRIDAGIGQLTVHLQYCSI